MPILERRLDGFSHLYSERFLHVKLVSGMNEEERSRILKGAAKGFAEEQNLLGLMHLAGDGVQQDAIEGFRWFQRAAGQGLKEGQYNLAELYRCGIGVGCDFSEARRYHLFAAEQGLADAQYALGQMLEFGQGGPEDCQAAAQWYRRAAIQDHPAAQYFLGGLYVEGKGVPRDMVEAYFWFSVAAELDDPNGADCRDMIATQLTAEQLAATEKRLEKYFIKEPFSDTAEEPEELP